MDFSFRDAFHSQDIGFYDTLEHQYQLDLDRMLFKTSKIYYKQVQLAYQSLKEKYLVPTNRSRLESIKKYWNGVKKYLNGRYKAFKKSKSEEELNQWFKHELESLNKTKLKLMKFIKYLKEEQARPMTTSTLVENLSQSDDLLNQFTNNYKEVMQKEQEHMDKAIEAMKEEKVQEEEAFLSFYSELK